MRLTVLQILKLFRDEITHKFLMNANILGPMFSMLALILHCHPVALTCQKPSHLHQFAGAIHWKIWITQTECLKMRTRDQFQKNTYSSYFVQFLTSPSFLSRDNSNKLEVFINIFSTQKLLKQYPKNIIVDKSAFSRDMLLTDDSSAQSVMGLFLCSLGNLLIIQ